MIAEIPYEVFTYSEFDPMCFENTPNPTNMFPYMVFFFFNYLNCIKFVQASFNKIFYFVACKYRIWCKVVLIFNIYNLLLYTCLILVISVLKVTESDKFERISGTSVRLNKIS